jgi:hypothetical protein
LHVAQHSSSVLKDQLLLTVDSSDVNDSGDKMISACQPPADNELSYLMDQHPLQANTGSSSDPPYASAMVSTNGARFSNGTAQSPLIASIDAVNRSSSCYSSASTGIACEDQRPTMINMINTVAVYGSSHSVYAGPASPGSGGIAAASPASSSDVAASPASSSNVTMSRASGYDTALCQGSRSSSSGNIGAASQVSATDIGVFVSGAASCIVFSTGTGTAAGGPSGSSTTDTATDGCGTATAVSGSASAAGVAAVGLPVVVVTSQFSLGTSPSNKIMSLYDKHQLV